MNLKIDSFCDEEINANTYLVSGPNECIIIDPANNIKTLSKFIGDKKVCGILLTHGHYDHFKRIEELINLYPAPVILHHNALNKLRDPSLSCAAMFGYAKPCNIEPSLLQPQNSGNITLGNFDIKIIELTGHTNCSVGYLINNHFFLGDALFYNSVGRWDLPTGSYPALKDTTQRIKKLDDNIICYPGHEDSFTILEAKMYNPYLK